MSLLFLKEKNMNELYNLELAKKITGIDDEKLLNFYINALIGKISYILGYNIIKHDAKELVQGINSNMVYFKDRPINSLSVVRYYEQDITPNCKIISDRKIMLPFELCNQEEIYVEYSAGLEKLSEAIQMFLFSQVASMNTQMGNDGLKSYSIESISYSFVEAKTRETDFINQVKTLFGGI